MYIVGGRSVVEGRMILFLYTTGKEEILYMTDNDLIQWKRHFVEGRRFVFFNKGDMIGLSPEYVVRWKKYDGHTEHFSKTLDYVEQYAEGIKAAKKEVSGTLEETKEEVIPDEKSTDLELPYADADKTHWHLCKIECKCGYEQYYRAPVVRNMDTCNQCSERVYTDYKQGWIETEHGQARLITNKYKVDISYRPTQQWKE